MDDGRTRTDPMAALVDRDTASADLVPDEDGDIRVAFAPDELVRLNAYLADELTDGIKASRDRWARAIRNYRIYEAMPPDTAQAADGNRDPVIPIAKRNANQTISWIINRVLSKKPVVKAEPRAYGEMDVVYIDEETQSLAMERRSVEKVATDLEDLLHDKLERGMNFRSALQTFVTDVVVGASPALLKIAYDNEERIVRELDLDAMMPAGQPAPKRTNLEFRSREVTISRGSPYKLLPISTLNFVTPADMTEIQESTWIAERLPRLDPTTIRQRIASRIYDLCHPGRPVPRSMIEFLITGTAPDPADVPVQDLPRQDNREAGAKPQRDLQDAFEVWFDWPVHYGLTPEGEPDIRMESCFGHYHLGRRQLLFCKLNPYWFQKRPYVPGFYRKRAHQWSAGSIVEDMAPFQDVVSSLYRLQVQNAVQATLKAFMVREGSAADKSLVALQNTGGVRPGSIIRFSGIPEQEIIPFQTGGATGSLFNEMNMAMGEADRLAGISNLDYAEIPGRTADAAIARVMEAAKAQTSEAYNNVRDALGEAFTMYIEMLRQFAPTGEIVAVNDPVRQEMMRRVIKMPRQSLEQNFEFIVRARSDDETKEAERERLTVDYGLMMQSNRFLLECAPGLLAANSTPLHEEFYKILILREEELFRRFLGLYSRDAENLVLDKKELEDLILIKRQLLAEQMAQQQRMMNAQPDMAEGMMNDQAMGAPAPGNPPAGNTLPTPAGLPQ